MKPKNKTADLVKLNLEEQKILLLTTFVSINLLQGSFYEKVLCTWKTHMTCFSFLVSLLLLLSAPDLPINITTLSSILMSVVQNVLSKAFAPWAVLLAIFHAKSPPKQKLKVLISITLHLNQFYSLTIPQNTLYSRPLPPPFNGDA